MRLEDLPSWAQAQVLRKMQEQEARKKQVSLLPVERPVGGGKYHNQKTQRILEDGTVLNFDSMKEARRFDQLLPLFRAGKIRELKLQPQFTLQEAYTTPEGKRVRAIRYQADFSYLRDPMPDHGAGINRWLYVVEDVKSEATKTRVYEIKKKLMWEKFGIEIAEV